MANFATQAELEAYLHMPTASANATLAAIALAGASDAIRTFCGHTFDPLSSQTAYVRGHGTPYLVLPWRNVRAITSVTPYSGNVAQTALASTDYRLRFSDVIERTGEEVWAVDQQYQVVADVQYSAVPDVVKLVCLSAAGRFYLQTGVSSETTGGVTTSYASADVDLNDSERRALRRYALRSLA